MHIEKIELINFRNYINQEVKLDSKLNIFIGNNAQGKTNVIESIYLSSLAKSFRTNSDEDMIKLDENNFKICLEYLKKDRKNKMEITLEKGNRKQVKINGCKLSKLSEMVGNVNIVLFSPDELKIIKQSPSIRRKFFDISITQIKPMYVHFVLQYNKILMQRNNLLKQARTNRSLLDTIDIWNEKLIEVGIKIINARRDYIDSIDNILKEKHNILSEDKENVKLEYVANVMNEDEFRKRLDKSIETDLQKGYTNYGPHKDDYIFYINDVELSKFGSQGQQRSAVLSYKLTEIEKIYNEFDEYPILLLDDVTSELDKNRISKLLDNLDKHQTIITCTDIENFELLSEYKLFEVENGNIKEVI